MLIIYILNEFYVDTVQCCGCGINCNLLNVAVCHQTMKTLGHSSSTQTLRDLEISLRTNHIEWAVCFVFLSTTAVGRMQIEHFWAFLHISNSQSVNQSSIRSFLDFLECCLWRHLLWMCCASLCFIIWFFASGYMPVIFFVSMNLITHTHTSPLC